MRQIGFIQLLNMFSNCYLAIEQQHGAKFLSGLVSKSKFQPTVRIIDKKVPLKVWASP